MKRLYELKNIAGVKDATANMARVSQQRMAMGEDFNQLSGEDITALGFNAHGGHGCISVTSNVAPRLCSEFQAACLKGDYATALKLQDKLAPLHINLFVETSPAPIKYAMSLIGKCANTLRLPMVPASEKAQAAVREAMVHAGLDQLTARRPASRARSQSAPAFACWASTERLVACACRGRCVGPGCLAKVSISGKRRLPVRRPYRSSSAQHSKFRGDCAWTKSGLTHFHSTLRSSQPPLPRAPWRASCRWRSLSREPP